MLRALELFWMALTGVCAAGALFFVIAGTMNEALILFGCGVVAGARYYMRRKQRLRMEKEKL